MHLCALTACVSVFIPTDCQPNLQAMVLGLLIVLWFQLKRRGKSTKGGLNTLLNLAAEARGNLGSLAPVFQCRVFCPHLPVLSCTMLRSCNFCGLRATAQQMGHACKMCTHVRRVDTEC